MHVAVDLNLNWFLQLIVTALIVGIGLHRLVKNTASKYFVVDATFDSSSSSSSFSHRYNINNEKIMTEVPPETCPVCAVPAKKRCSGCKIVSYCSQACQKSHWHSEHMTKCKNSQSLSKADSKQSSTTWRAKKAYAAISLVPSRRTSNISNESKKILFPYEEFVELFNWDTPGFPPCGLLNCGNSCFANVVLQCLNYTKPLVAYLLEKGHRRECRRNDWCFLCEFQNHLEKANRSQHPFSPINILSRLPNIGGNLGYGSQEDAHELMRFAIDTMQSVCLDEFGGEKAVHPSSQETTLIQHIFGGHLQSQVICTNCNSISNQLENMMDLTVEIQGDAASLEECLDQFTAKEWLHGENMYKCDRCNDYVTAWKRLTIQLPPNILTIALKRFQSGRFGKLNKRVAFPETLDISPYMSKAGDDGDIYKLYAVIVHVDMLNASFFGHYICYIKDFHGNWYRIDDCKVARVDLYDVLSQGAYMLLYSRIRPRPTCLYPLDSKIQETKKNEGETEELQPSPPKQNVECPSTAKCDDSAADSCVTNITFHEEHISEDVKQKIEMVDSVTSSSVVKDVLSFEDETAPVALGLSDRLLSSDASLTGTNSKEADMMEVEPTSLISDASNCNGYSLKKDSPLTQNRVCGKVGMPLDILPSSGNAARRSEGSGCSGTKLKPLFPVGFLGKRTLNKCNVKDVEILKGNSERRVAGTNSCGPSSEFANPDLCYQNGVIITDEEKPNSGYEDESSKMHNHATQVGFSEEPAEAMDLVIGDSCGPADTIDSVNISKAENMVLVAEETRSSMADQMVN